MTWLPDEERLELRLVLRSRRTRRQEPARVWILYVPETARDVRFLGARGWTPTGSTLLGQTLELVVVVGPEITHER